MSHDHSSEASDSLLEQIRQHVLTALPDAQVQVRGAGGHFELDVVSAEFAGKRTLAKHRLVLQAIAPLMKGHDAPVHAIDRLGTTVPE